MSDALVTAQTVSPDEVRNFRQRAMAHGYPLIRVRTSSKAPLAPGWQSGEADDVLLDVEPGSLNTGLLLGGLRCIDVDVDDRQLVSLIREKARAHLPGCALARCRADSPRVALLFRAAEGQPSKRSIDGTHGKIEVLGAGQQVVVHGVHPAGAEYFWTNGLGPDVVKRTHLPAISEQQIQDFLSACAPLIGADAARLSSTSSLDALSGSAGSLFPAPGNFSSWEANNDLSAGVEDPNWFGRLTPHNKKTLVEACLQVLDNRAKDPRHPWLRVLFALGDAERLGCPDARELALKWSRQGASWKSEEDFDRAWKSYKFRPRGVTVGTLLSMVSNEGLDLSPWRDPILAQPQADGTQERGPIPAQPQNEVAAAGAAAIGELKGDTYTSKEALELLNAHFFIGETESEVGIYRINADGSASFLPEKDFKLLTDNIWVDVNEKPVPAEKFWRRHKDRKELKIVFDPSGDKPGEHNLWRGFAFKPAGGWDKQWRLLRHIYKVICRRDRQKFHYLMRWLAWAIQHPDEAPGTIVVLKSRTQGTGKSTLGAVMCDIFGKHGRTIDDKEQLLGRFNDELETTSFILAEEILWAGDSRTKDKLKSRITSSVIPVEAKYRGRREVPNRLHVIMTTNHDHAVPAGAKDRRFFVLDVSEERAQDGEWFGPLHEDLAEGGKKQFLWLLLNLDLGDFHPRQLVKTEEALEQQRMSGDSVGQWSQACIEADDITGIGFEGRPSGEGLGRFYSSDNLRRSYARYCQEHRLHPANENNLGKALAEMFGPRRRQVDPTSDHRRAYGYDVLDGDAWQKRLDARLGIG